MWQRWLMGADPFFDLIFLVFIFTRSRLPNFADGGGFLLLAEDCDSTLLFCLLDATDNFS